MQEIELKFQVPQAALAALEADLRQRTGGERPAQVLQAAYFDTPQRHLARARAALRVRREDEAWVQTLKAAGANALTRLEDNRRASPPSEHEAIWPDLSRHEGPAREALVRDLGWDPQADPLGRACGLQQLYRTDMRRLRARHTVHQGTQRLGTVELALDLGEIAAGELRLPVRELEIELLEGHPLAVIEAARAWVPAHGLWLDSQTKAHRGDQLAREAVSAQPSPMPPARRRAPQREGLSASQVRLHALNAALEQASLNQSEAALGLTQQDDAQHLPWLKAWVLGLRRVRRLGGHPSADAAALSTLLTQLRPAPGRYATAPQATAWARANEATLLSLNLLAQVVAQA